MMIRRSTKNNKREKNRMRVSLCGFGDDDDAKMRMMILLCTEKERFRLYLWNNNCKNIVIQVVKMVIMK